jgi:hypothetical protein
VRGQKKHENEDDSQKKHENEDDSVRGGGSASTTKKKLTLDKLAELASNVSTVKLALQFITSHLIAVFILGRMFLDVDTTFAWASGAPTGLLHGPWNVRLIPHY